MIYSSHAILVFFMFLFIWMIFRKEFASFSENNKKFIQILFAFVILLTIFVCIINICNEIEEEFLGIFNAFNFFLALIGVGILLIPKLGDLIKLFFLNCLLVILLLFLLSPILEMSPKISNFFHINYEIDIALMSTLSILYFALITSLKREVVQMYDKQGTLMKLSIEFLYSLSVGILVFNSIMLATFTSFKLNDSVRLFFAIVVCIIFIILDVFLKRRTND